MESSIGQTIGTAMIVVPVVLILLGIVVREVLEEHKRGTLKESLVACGSCAGLTLFLIGYVGLAVYLINHGGPEHQLDQAIEKPEKK